MAPKLREGQAVGKTEIFEKQILHNCSVVSKIRKENAVRKMSKMFMFKNPTHFSLWVGFGIFPTFRVFYILFLFVISPRFYFLVDGKL